jgi:hypothetical protein
MLNYDYQKKQDAEIFRCLAFSIKIVKNPLSTQVVGGCLRVEFVYPSFSFTLLVFYFPKNVK